MQPNRKVFQSFVFGLVVALGSAFLPNPFAAGALWAQESSSSATADSAFTRTDKFGLLSFEFQALRMVTLTRGPFRGRVYWYMLYTLENKSAEDREFFLSISASSDRGKSYSDVLLPDVEKTVERRLGHKLWGQVDKFAILADRDPKDPRYNYTAIKGREKRACVAVFNRIDPSAVNIVIDVSGLGGDLRVVEGDDGARVLEDKVLRLKFKRRGDEYGVDQDRFRIGDREWIDKTRKPKPSGSGGGNSGEGSSGEGSTGEGSESS